MESKQNIHLTSAELSSLWSNYLSDSLSVCVFNYFLNIVEDLEIKPVLEHAITISKQHLEYITNVFEEEKIPIPKGFNEEDIYPNAPRLFNDTFFLYYIKYMAKGGLATYGTILPNMIREDIRHYFTQALTETAQLFNKATDLLLTKGLAIRPPYIPYPKEVEFVRKQSFISGWIGEQRPLSGLEIMHLYANIQTNKMGEAVVLSFAQVAKSEEVRDFLQRGIKISEKHIDIFAKYLSANNLPVPMTWDHEVHDVTEAPFSDKLMLYIVNVLNGMGIGDYGTAISMSQRRDISADYARLSAEVAQYAEDGLNILIDNGWLERPPHAADRDELMKQKKD